MKTEEKIILDTDDEAAQLVTVKGWASRSGHFFGNSDQAESMARYDGCTHKACRDCGEPTIKHWLICDACRIKKNIDRYKAMPTQEWDGTTPLYSEFAEQYFYDSEELRDYCHDNECTISSLRLVICKPNHARQIDGDHWVDDLPDDGDLPPELDAAIEELNKVIRQLPPLSWSPGEFAAIVDKAVLE